MVLPQPSSPDHKKCHMEFELPMALVSVTLGILLFVLSQLPVHIQVMVLEMDSQDMGIPTVLQTVLGLLGNKFHKTQHYLLDYHHNQN